MASHAAIGSISFGYFELTAVIIMIGIIIDACVLTIEPPFRFIVSASPIRFAILLTKVVATHAFCFSTPCIIIGHLELTPERRER